MRPRFMDIAMCPIDKVPLSLLEWESIPTALSNEALQLIKALGLDASLFDRDIVTGVLLNRSRKIFYPIYKGVPRLLVFPTGVTRQFVKEYAERLARELPGYTLPQGTPPPGEEDILRSFSNEWVSYDWNPDAYWNVSAEDMHRSMRFLLDLDRKPVRRKRILEVGIGIGGIADYVSRSEESELVGVDLSYAVDAAYRNFGRNPFLHIVQASAFSPPFEDNTFDLVYSQGVIMCTYSTKAAFDRLARLPKKEGRLYIWVYSHYDEERTLVRRILMGMERIIRPVVWPLPDGLQTVALAPLVPLYMFYQNVVRRYSDKRNIKYGWREAIHAARDRFTPRYVHRHSEEEVSGWFREAGYDDLQSVSKRPAPDFVPLPLVTATGIDGVRH
jgi:uncharacterized protein YbaR (Trm112 family)/SAM-dependent methyltransferase